MWRGVTDAVGIQARDSLWDYSDLMPTASDIDDPTTLIERLQARARGEEPVQDEMDDALARLLSGEDEAGGSPSRAEGAAGAGATAPSDGAAAGAADADAGSSASSERDAPTDPAPDADDGPEDPRPV